MKLFLCSHFSSVGSLIKEEIDNKKVAFIPTASLREGYTGYVGSARKLFNKLGAAVTEIDISTEAYLTIQSVFEDADVIYFTGGNSFFLIDQLRKTGTDELLKKELAKGKLMIGESAGAIICAPSIQYIEQMDEKPYCFCPSGLLSCFSPLILAFSVPVVKCPKHLKEQQKDTAFLQGNTSAKQSHLSCDILSESERNHRP